jgi:hypothetical protein
MKPHELDVLGLTGDERPASCHNGPNQLTHQGGFADAGGARDEQKLSDAWVQLRLYAFGNGCYTPPPTVAASAISRPCYDYITRQAVWRAGRASELPSIVKESSVARRVTNWLACEQYSNVRIRHRTNTTIISAFAISFIIVNEELYHHDEHWHHRHRHRRFAAWPSFAVAMSSSAQCRPKILCT